MVKTRVCVLLTLAALAFGSPATIIYAAEDAGSEANAPSPAASPVTEPVAFEDVNYDESGDTGKLTLAGHGNPGAKLLVYFDDAPFAQVLIGSDGAWKAEAETKLARGRHVFRADLLDDQGNVVGNASIVDALAPKQ
jgi:hypothetical protein